MKTYQENALAANYHRVWIRFRKSDLKRRLHVLRQEMSEKTSRKVSNSELIESIVEQFLDKHSPNNEPLEETA